MCMHEHVAARNAMQIIVTSKTSDSSDLHVRQMLTVNILLQTRLYYCTRTSLNTI